MRHRMRWIFRLLASRFSGDTLTCILLFTSNRIPLDCISGQSSKKGRSWVLQHLHPDGLGLVGWCHCFYISATDRPSTVVGEMPK